MSHWERSLGPILLSVEHRRAPDDGGPTLRVREGSRGRELLRFDCFDRAPHFHVDPGGRDELTRLDPLRDNVTWTVEELRRDLPGYLEKAGFAPASGPLPWSAAECEACLREAEAAMRNPPVSLDDLELEVLETRLSEKWNTFPRDVLPAWVAEMDFPLAEPVRRVLERAVARNDVGYAIEPRETGLPEVFARRMAERFGWEADPARVVLLADVVQGLYIAIERFSEPGDGAIVQTPIYPPFLSAVANTRRRLVENRLVPGDARWEIDLDALRAAVDSRTRLLLLCNPHNPTGRVLTRAELEALAALACENDWVVVSDEIHADLVHPGHVHLPFAALGPEVAARTVTLTSATKAFNIPGLRCAVAHFGSEALQQRFELPPTRHVRGGLGILGLYATIAAWRDSQPWLDQVLAHLARNRARVVRFVEESLPGVTCHEPEATYLAWLDFRALALPTTPGRHLLRETRVALSDGRHFGAAFEGYARLNFATSRAILEQILERVAAALAAAD